MLELDSPHWSELRHAYGIASDIPALLRQLSNFPVCRGKEEPWFSLWSALAHQGDVYSASFAAVPHVVAAIASAPARAGSSYFHFPAWIEICRHRQNAQIPEDLRQAYFESLRQLPNLVAAASSGEWDAEFVVCALSSIAASKGFHSIAEAVVELTPDVASEFLASQYGR